AAPVRATRHFAAGVEYELARHLARRLRAERVDGRHRALRTALFAEGPMAGQAAHSQGLGGIGHVATGFKWEQSQKRLGTGLRLSILALPLRGAAGPRRFPP